MNDSLIIILLCITFACVICFIFMFISSIFSEIEYKRKMDESNAKIAKLIKELRDENKKRAAR